MTEEKIKAKAKEQFPNDEFKQQAVINAINWATKELQEQIEKMRNCQNCENWNWKHSRCEKKSKGDCFKQSKWVLRKILSYED